MDLARLPDPEKLREIAFHIEKLRNVILPVWQTAVQDETTAGVLAMLRDRSMLDDLVRWAEYLEEEAVRGLQG